MAEAVAVAVAVAGVSEGWVASVVDNVDNVDVVDGVDYDAAVAAAEIVH